MSRRGALGARGRLGAWQERAEVRWGAIVAGINQRPVLARLYGVTRGVIHKQSDYRLSLNAAGAAFWLVISVFPAVIAVIMIFGLVLDPADLAGDVEEITRRAPNSFGAVLASQAQQVAATDAGSLSLGLAISLVVTLWSVSSGGYALFRAIRQAYDLPPQNYIVARSRAFGAALGAVLTLGVLVGGGALILGWLDRQSQTLRVGVSIVGAVVLAVAFTLLVVWTFRFSIAERVPMRSLLPGAVIGTCATVGLLIGVTVFGSYMVNYQAIYGALTGVIVALLAGYTIMYVLLLCAVFNQQWQPLPTTITGQTALL